MKNNYTITEDILFKNFLRSKPNITPATKTHYTAALTKFYKATQEPLETIITKCKNQQDKVIETTTSQTTDENGNTIIEKTITEFDVNRPEAYINIYINTFIDHCKETGIKDNSINNYLTQISAVLIFYGVKLPNIEKFKRQTPKWNLLQKEDFKFIIQDSILSHAALIKHLESTGMRLKDALNITLGEYMTATSDYHNCTDINDFIDTAPQDMIATWDFIPEKTKKYNIPCLTFSDQETNNLILQNLRKIKDEYLPRLNKEKNLNLKVTKDDALFSSRKSNYKGHLLPRGVSDMFYKKNKKLKEHHIKLIKEAIDNGELAPEDFEKEVNKIPKFHAHGCRKYFISTISKNCGDLRLCALMEGHTTPLATDAAYVKHDVKDVKEAYMMAIPDLSLENTETKVYTSEVRREMETKINYLDKENETLKEKYNKKEVEVNQMNERLSKIEKLFEHMDNMTDDELLSLFEKRKKDK